MVCVAVLAIFFVPYLIVNHMSFERIYGVFIFQEEKIPFVPWTFVIYFSLFIQLLIVLRSMPPWLFKNAVSLAFLLVIIHLITFITVPIKYPREAYPEDNQIVGLFRDLDTPNNCLPSLHVSLTLYLSFLYSFTKRPKLFLIAMWLWSSAIIVSVFTTKQHYILDVLCSIVTTGTAIILSPRILRPRY